MKKWISTLIIGSFVLLHGQENQSFNLEEAIQYALENNFNAKVAENNYRTAKKLKWETTAIGLPQIDAEFLYSNNIINPTTLLPAEITGGEAGTFVPVNFNPRHNASATVTLRQLLFDGSYIIGLQSAKTFMKISELAKSKTDQTIREAVINSYGNILVSERTIEILDDNITVLKKTLHDTEKIYENGMTEEEDVEQLQITLSSIQNQRDRSERYRKIAYKMFNITLGIPIDNKTELTENLDNIVDKFIAESIPYSKYTIKDHIDFQIAENDRYSKELSVKYEKSKALPSLAAFLNFGYNGANNEFDLLSKEQEWFDQSMLGLSLNVPVFSSGAREARTQQAKIELETATLQLEETIQQLELALETAKTDYEFQLENYQNAKSNLSLARRIEKKQEIKFFEGISSSFDLSQAQNQLYAMQKEYLQSMLNLITSKAALEKAINTPIND